MIGWRTPPRAARRKDVARAARRKDVKREDVIEVDGHSFTVQTRHHRGARRMTLRIDAKANCAILTLPNRTSIASGLDFAREKAGWVADKLSVLPPLTPFVHGAVFPYRGAPLCIRHFPLAGSNGNSKPLHAGDILEVPGAESAISRKVGDWLRDRARETLSAATAEKADQIGRDAPPIRLTDPRTRWGSCSSRGRLALSWRLIMAPEMVLDYVVAHEVAHLEELNHGARFHKIVTRLAENSADAEAWLSREGSGLLRYG